ncbi:unnamed protein product [Bathycoccus prasinos]
MYTHRQVWSPKTTGSFHVQNYYAGAERGSNCSVLFSSVSSLLGGAGQVNYSAANAALDASAQYNRSKGESVVSLQWGAWEDTGMAARNGITLHRAVLSGIGVVSPEAGLAVLHNAFFESMHSFHTKHTMPLSGVFTGVAFSWPAFIASDKKPVLREFERNKYTSGKEKDFTSAKVEPNTETDLRGEHISNEVSREERSSDELREIVSEAVTNALGRQILTDASLVDEGMDSLAAVELGSTLQTATGTSMPATLAFDYPTIDAIVDLVSSSLTASDTNLVVRPVSRAGQMIGNSNALFDIVAEKHDFHIPPGCNIETLVFREGSANYKTIVNSRNENDIIGSMNCDRFDDYRFAQNFQFTPIIRFCSCIKQIDLFDFFIFSINQNETLSMDPQQRILLESFHQINSENLEFDKATNLKKVTNIAIGATKSLYGMEQLKWDQYKINPYMGTGMELSVLCGRISYTFGFKGPSVCVDTACSSSLVATQLAANTIISMESQIAYAGGVSLNIGLLSFQIGSAANMLSSDGRCKTLDIRADGYAKGECCGVMRITPDIETQSATIDVVAKLGGCGINQDGRSSSLTAPNGPSQQTLIVDVLKRANYNASGVDRLEMHGTGTSLGDPIEVGAALEVLVSSPKSMQTTSSVPFLSSQKRNLTLEGAKTRTGHCEPGAGTVGLMFAISRMSQRLISSLTHLRVLNPHVTSAMSRHNGDAKRQVKVLFHFNGVRGKILEWWLAIGLHSIGQC